MSSGSRNPPTRSGAGKGRVRAPTSPLPPFKPDDDPADMLASVTRVPEYQHSVPSYQSGGSPSKRARVLSPSPPPSPSPADPSAAKSKLAQDTVAAFLALSDNPEIGSMRAHGDLNRMDAEVALVMVNKLSTWMSLRKFSEYLDSHLNITCKLQQQLATLSSLSRQSSNQPANPGSGSSGHVTQSHLANPSRFFFFFFLKKIINLYTGVHRRQSGDIE